MSKKNNFIKIFVIIICLGAVTLFALIQAGAAPAFVQNYKNNFKKNISAICDMLNIELSLETQLYLDDMSAPSPKPTMIPAAEKESQDLALGYPSYEEEEEEAQGNSPLTTQKPKKTVSGDYLPIAFSAAENTVFTSYKSSIIGVNETSYQAYSPGGKLLWTAGIQMQTPILKTSGDYILICEKGAKKVSLYKGKKLIFGTKTEGDIITANLSENGDVVLVTEKEYYKAQVVVFNKSGKRIFAWDSGSYEVLNAAISPNRQVALAMLNTDEGADCFIACMDVDGNTRYKTDTIKNTIVFSLNYSGEKLTALSDNKYIGISSKGKVTWEYDFGGKKLKRFTYDTNGNILLLFESESTGELVTVTPSGKNYKPIKTESMPNTIDIKGGNVSYNNGREAVITDLNGKKVYKTDCESDIKQIHITNSQNVMCIYSSSIQVRKAVKQPKVTAEPTAVPEPEVTE